ncbi:hypothetical protein BG011_001376 [Mortierella polycephala]|uniref:Zn(2)-C6 fungal-type domain-containing protein n=1 Tax=Mortierella polycephala TaxID=41804 RepID=A0A9P6U580_9FUNG|nr:hypothetical protein BG011_001376 [Mortierella polycephala]
MPLQEFKFHADNSVSMHSAAAINRKSCDHCFLNRKTCDKVRLDANSGEKCKRCAKDNRPCTFTPTVHLYHIADCVGLNNCRAKVNQAIGGRKKDAQIKTVEIPINLDMDSQVDMVLFDFLQKQSNLLMYNNRIKSYLVEDLLGISPDHDSEVSSIFDQCAQGQSISSNSVSPSPSPSKRSFMNNSGIPSSSCSSSQGPTKYRIMSPVEPQQSYRVHPYVHHQRSNSDDRGRHTPRGPYSPAIRPLEDISSSRPQSMVNGEAFAGIASNPGSLSPIDAVNLNQRRHSDNMAVNVMPYNTPMGSVSSPYQQHQMVQQQPAHPYAQQSPYPQASFFPQIQAQPQQQSMNSYRTTSPFPPSPVAPSPIQTSPLPPSPLELALTINTDFGSLNNLSNQNLPSLFDTNLTMGSDSQVQTPFQAYSPRYQYQRHRRGLSSSSTKSSRSMSSMASASDNTNNYPGTPATPAKDPAPMVITTTNAEGNEVGFYYAVPDEKLNPNCSDADLFQDFTMMDEAVGEEFVWIENLFEDSLLPDANVMTVGSREASGTIASYAASTTSAIPIPNPNAAIMGTYVAAQQQNQLQQQQQQQQQQSQWSDQCSFEPPSLGSECAGRFSQSLQG